MRLRATRYVVRTAGALRSTPSLLLYVQLHSPSLLRTPSLLRLLSSTYTFIPPTCSVRLLSPTPSLLCLLSSSTYTFIPLPCSIRLLSPLLPHLHSPLLPHLHSPTLLHTAYAFSPPTPPLPPPTVWGAFMRNRLHRPPPCSTLSPLRFMRTDNPTIRNRRASLKPALSQLQLPHPPPVRYDGLCIQQNGSEGSHVPVQWGCDMYPLASCVLRPSSVSHFLHLLSILPKVTPCPRLE
ncbi:hypothetical protein BJ875DRAFT_232966 [Amylocarpus encephaloides]|uniref:Uncharacterized protein n=1 Tax=Amylocarpus encephaloides TaxID=45428 RepID=A0A9P8C734_9HELO|nr:hypothetical protein BJ875DRAFT_232966 [Amylocarpus encephaloides]